MSGCAPQDGAASAAPTTGWAGGGMWRSIRARARSASQATRAAPSLRASPPSLRWRRSSRCEGQTSGAGSSPRRISRRSRRARPCASCRAAATPPSGSAWRRTSTAGSVRSTSTGWSAKASTPSVYRSAGGTSSARTNCRTRAAAPHGVRWRRAQLPPSAPSGAFSTGPRRGGSSCSSICTARPAGRMGRSTRAVPAAPSGTATRSTIRSPCCDG
mmetsp:Transcript_20878/g.59568  ORF Transcript_20878/g.59568 Transcript_20878/m.59568 type:complete len:215 (+) Transcript_20878:331-975(+)